MKVTLGVTLVRCTTENFSVARIMDHPALGVIIPGLVEAACQSVMEASHGLKGGEDESWARL